MISTSNSRPSSPVICECCGSMAIQNLLVREQLEYLCCQSCGHCLKVALGATQADFDSAQSAYFGHDSILLNSKRSLFDDEILEFRRRIASQFLSSGGPVIEVGPGAGFFAEWLRDRGHDVELVEYSPPLAEALRLRLGVKVEVGTLEACALPEASANAFFSFHVIEHVPDPVLHLATGLKYVRPGGYGFIATPNSRSFQQRFLPRMSPNFDEAHLRVFSIESLRECCIAAGWHTISFETPEFSSDWLRVASKFVRKLRGENESSTAGKYANSLSPQFWWIIRLFKIISTPFRLLQGLLKGGNEVLIIVQRPILSSTAAGNQVVPTSSVWRAQNN